MNNGAVTFSVKFAVVPNKLPMNNGADTFSVKVALFPFKLDKTVTLPLKVTLPLNVDVLPSVIPPLSTLRVWLNVDASFTVNELLMETLLSIFNVLLEMILPLKVVSSLKVISPCITTLLCIFNWVLPDKLPSMTTSVKLELPSKVLSPVKLLLPLMVLSLFNIFPNTFLSLLSIISKVLFVIWTILFNNHQFGGPTDIFYIIIKDYKIYYKIIYKKRLLLSTVSIFRLSTVFIFITNVLIFIRLSI